MRILGTINCKTTFFKEDSYLLKRIFNLRESQDYI